VRNGIERFALRLQVLSGALLLGVDDGFDLSIDSARRLFA
jgi:hypothetical protein